MLPLFSFMTGSAPFILVFGVITIFFYRIWCSVLLPNWATLMGLACSPNSFWLVYFFLIMPPCFVIINFWSSTFYMLWRLSNVMVALVEDRAAIRALRCWTISSRSSLWVLFWWCFGTFREFLSREAYIFNIFSEVTTVSLGTEGYELWLLSVI